jgi:twitching motility protein PilI
VTDQDLNLRSLARRPFDALREMQRRAVERRTGRVDATEEWVGIGLQIGSASYVVPREEVREIMQRPPLTRVPGAQNWLLGLANVRGQLIPIVDLRQLCGMPAAQPDRRTRVVLVNNEEAPMGVQVDEVFGFRRFVVDERVADNGGADSGIEAFLDGMFRHDGEDWPVLSFFRVLRNERLLSAT